MGWVARVNVISVALGAREMGNRAIALVAWLVVAIGLILLFEFEPQFARFPAVLLLIPAAAIFAWRFVRSRRKGTICWRREVYRGLRANHLIFAGVIAAAVLVAWLVLILPLVRTDHRGLILFIVAPVCLLGFVASAAFWVGLYYAQGDW